jgi:hypothetical protein
MRSEIDTSNDHFFGAPGTLRFVFPISGTARLAAYLDDYAFLRVAA